MRRNHDTARRRRCAHLALAALQIGMLGCIDKSTGPRAGPTETHALVLQQEYGGRWGRVYLLVRLNALKADDPKFNCNGTIVTANTETYLGTVEAAPMRVQQASVGNL